MSNLQTNARIDFPVFIKSSNISSVTSSISSFSLCSDSQDKTSSTSSISPEYKRASCLLKNTMAGI